MLFVLLLLENTSLLGIGGFFNYYALLTLKILLWSLLGVIIIMFPANMFSGLVRLRGMVIAFALLFSTFYLVCYILMGMFTAFGKNVYSMTPTGITLNMLGMLSALIGGELCRSFLINHLAGKRPFRAIVGFSILFAIFYISLGNISSLNDSMAVLNFISNSVFPQLTLSIVASCLAYLSGPLPSILYLGIIRSFGFLSPYIPSPEMIPLLLFQVFFPLISMYAMMKLYAKEASKEDRSHRNEGITIGWIATAALSVAIVWFSVGVFPIYPSVILTGSMEPKIMPGDMILVKKMSCEHVDVGDIIMFNNGEGIYITHRIIKKSEDTGEILFTKVPTLEWLTKGNYSVSAVLEATYNEANQIWSKEYPLITEQAFSSGQTSANLSLPIRDYIQLANSIEQDTGVTTSASMTITFRVNASATIEGTPVEDTSVSTLVFDLSKDVLVMNGEPNSVQTKNVEETITENIFPKKMVFFITMPLLLSMVGCLLYLLKYTCGVREDPVKRKLKEICKKYHSRIVELYPGETIYRKETIMVKSFQDLLLVADELNKPIFKNSASQDTDIDFYVIDELNTYIFTNKVAEKVLT